MNLRFSALLLSSVVLLAAASAAVADDIAPPAWRGQPGSSFQAWDFLTDSTTPAPEAADNNYGSPTALVTVGAFASGYIDTYPPGVTDARDGLWDLGSLGTIDLVIPNSSRTGPNTWKDIVIQVTYYEDIQVAPVVTVPGGSLVDSDTLVAQNIPGWGTFYTDVYYWHLEPNPLEEQILITSDEMWGSMIDQVVVDTICMPEPTTMALLAIGGIALLRRRRR